MKIRINGIDIYISKSCMDDPEKLKELLHNSNLTLKDKVDLLRAIYL